MKCEDDTPSAPSTCCDRLQHVPVYRHYQPPTTSPDTQAYREARPPPYIRPACARFFFVLFFSQHLPLPVPPTTSTAAVPEGGAPPPEQYSMDYGYCSSSSSSDEGCGYGYAPPPQPSYSYGYPHVQPQPDYSNPDDETNFVDESWSVKELKQECWRNGLRNFKRLNKRALIELLNGGVCVGGSPLLCSPVLSGPAARQRCDHPSSPFACYRVRCSLLAKSRSKGSAGKAEP